MTDNNDIHHSLVSIGEISSTGQRYHRRTEDIHEAEQSSQIWLVSFTDVMALMLTFFVLLFSMTTPVAEEWSEMTSTIQSEFNKFYGTPIRAGTQDVIDIDKINFNQALNTGYLGTLIEDVIANNSSLNTVALISQPDSIIISLPRDLLFSSGEAEVKEEGRRVLYALGGPLSRIKNQIEIVGHADPRPISSGTAEFVSNWDLSMARAAHVAAILEKVGYENDVVIHGLSSGRYEDLQGVLDEEQRLDLSRRVDIVVMNYDGTRKRSFLSSE